MTLVCYILSCLLRPELTKEIKREISEKLSVTENTLEHNHGDERKGGK